MLSIQPSAPTSAPTSSAPTSAPTSAPIPAPPPNSSPPKPTRSKPLCTPNLLPCRIHHDGSVNASGRYWDPRLDPDGTPISYFRGRKLKGKEVRVPAGYRGVVVRKKVDDEEGNEGGRWTADVRDEEEEKVGVLEEVAAFEEIVVWDHEKVVGDDHAFVKGMAEWIHFASAMHATGGGEGWKE